MKILISQKLWFSGQKCIDKTLEAVFYKVTFTFVGHNMWNNSKFYYGRKCSSIDHFCWPNCWVFLSLKDKKFLDNTISLWNDIDEFSKARRTDRNIRLLYYGFSSFVDCDKHSLAQNYWYTRQQTSLYNHVTKMRRTLLSHNPSAESIVYIYIVKLR